MGKLTLRALAARGLLDQVVLLNDQAGDAETHAHLLNFDTLHGRWEYGAEAQGEQLLLDGRAVDLARTDRLEALPLDGVDLAIDCTGAFKSRAKLAPYLAAGVRKILVSAPIASDALNLVYGVNHHLYDPQTHDIVTAASCTTNCLAPIVKVLHEAIGISHGSITTIHNITNTQTIIDRPGAKDLRRVRSGLTSLVPTTTGSARAITQIFPELTGRLDGHAVRVPLLTGSITDAVFEMKRATDRDEINGLFEAAAEGPLAGILGIEHNPLVSCDFVGDPRSSIVDGPSTMVVNGTQAKIYGWYDNEWGYANRMADLAVMILKGL